MKMKATSRVACGRKFIVALPDHTLGEYIVPCDTTWGTIMCRCKEQGFKLMALVASNGKMHAIRGNEIGGAASC